MPRFVVLTHDWPSFHWDFMLEDRATLRTWRLLARPDGMGAIVATPLPTHRVAYLDYEGPLSGNRGSVARWDRGDFRWRQGSEDQIEVELAGEILRGTATLRRSPGSDDWNYHFVADGSPASP